MIDADSGSRNGENVARSAYPQGTLWDRLDTKPGHRRSGVEKLGKGLVAWTPIPTQRGGVKPCNDLFWFDNLFNAYTNNWELPANEDELLAALDRACVGRQLTSTASVYTVFEVVRCGPDRLVIHAVNFDPSEPVPLRITFRCPAGTAIRNVRAFSPDHKDEEMPIRWSHAQRMLTAEIDHCAVYVVFVLETEPMRQ